MPAFWNNLTKNTLRNRCSQSCKILRVVETGIGKTGQLRLSEWKWVTV